MGGHRFVVVLVISFLATAMAVGLPPYRAYGIMGDMDDPHVVSIAEFALEAHNLRMSKVNFKVVNGASWIQDGLYWRLDIQLFEGSTYED